MPVLIFAVLCIGLTGAQDVFAGNAWFHSGSYAALLAGCVALMLWSLRRHRGFGLAAFGATAVAAAGLACALFAPDLQIFTGGPGESVVVNEPAGRIEFPLTVANTLQLRGEPEFVSPSGARTALGAGKRYSGAYIFWTQPHRAAYIGVTDERGNHVTMTQPENSSFLSPVLLFKDSAPIAGRPLPVDSFSVPSLQRTVKAVLFSGADLSAMQTLAGDPRPGILFAVEDARGRMGAGSIRFVRDGTSASVAGVALTPQIGTFPQVVIAPAPFFPLVLTGVLVFIAGVILALRSRSRSKT